MKVIFLESVPRVAKSGEIKDVADGYARNYLLPRKLAVIAGPQAMKLVEIQLKKKARVQAETEAEMKELARQLESKEVVLKAKAGADEKLYGSVTSADIAEELAKAGLNIDKRKIELAEPIHQLGSYEIEVKLTGEIVPKIKVTVQSEEAEKTETTEKSEKVEKVKPEKAEKEAKKKPAEKKPRKKKAEAPSAEKEAS